MDRWQVASLWFSLGRGCFTWKMECLSLGFYLADNAGQGRQGRVGQGRQGRQCMQWQGGRAGQGKVIRRLEYIML